MDYIDRRVKKKYYIVSLMMVFSFLLSACMNFKSFPLQMDHRIIFLNEAQEDISSYESNGKFYIAIPKKYEVNDLKLMLIKDQNRHEIENIIWNESEFGKFLSIDIEEEGVYQLAIEDSNENVIGMSKSFHVYVVENYITWKTIDPISEFPMNKIEVSFEMLAEIPSLKISLLHDDVEDELSLQWIEYKSFYEIENEGEYKIKITMEDENGIGISKYYDRRPLILDKTPPEIYIRHQEGNSLVNGRQGFKEKVSIDIEVSDPNLKEVSVLINEQPIDNSWIVEEGELRSSIMLDEDGEYIIDVCAKDQSDNVQCVSSAPLLIDQTLPMLSLESNDEQIVNDIKYIQLGTNIDIDVMDTNLKEVEIRNQDGLLDVDWGKYQAGYRGKLTLMEGTHELSIYAKDAVGNHQRISKTIIVDGTRPQTNVIYPDASLLFKKKSTIQIEIVEQHFDEQNVHIEMYKDGVLYVPKIRWKHNKSKHYASIDIDEDGEYTMDMHLTDMSGNTALYYINENVQDEFQTVTFLIDKQAPLVQVSFHEMREEDFYNHTRVANIAILEQNFDPKLVHISYIRDGIKETLSPSWVREIDTWVADITFQMEGSYEVEIHMKDKVGNEAVYEFNEEKSNKPLKISFTIDYQAPRISLEGVHHQSFTNKEIELQVNIDDVYLDEITILVLRNQLLYPIDMKRKETGRYSLKIEDDGEYVVLIQAIDKAGNETEIIKRSFTIDTISPSIDMHINHVLMQNLNEYISNEDCDLQIEWYDANIESVHLNISKNGSPFRVQSQENRLHVSLPIEKNQIIDYDVQIEVFDLAGNKSSKQIRLRQNTTLPEVVIENDIFQGMPKNTTWIPKLQGEGEEFQVVEAALYRNNEMIPKYQWGDEISEGGVYSLRVGVRDEAMNETRLLPVIEFVIDTKPPIIRIIDEHAQVEINNAQLPLNSTLRMYIEDDQTKNIQIEKFLVNGKPYELYNLKVDEHGKEYYPITFSEEKKIPIHIEAIDEAGNRLTYNETYDIQRNIKLQASKTESASNKDQVNFVSVLFSGICFAGVILFIYYRHK